MTELPEQGGSTPAPEPQPEPQLDDGGQGRDEKGRFSNVKPLTESPPEPPQSPPGPPPQAAEPARPPPGYVPQEALHQARQQVDEWQRRSLQHEREMADIRRQIAEQRPKPPPVAFDYDKPEDFIRQQLESQVQPVQQSQEAMREQFSRMMAADKFGEDVVSAAQKELEQRVYSNPAANRHVYDRIVRSPHPYAELVKWHKEQATLSRVGDDPDAFINAEVERRIAERASAGHPSQASQPPQPQQRLPQSLANARNDGPRSTSQAFSGPRPLSEIMGR